MPETAVAEVQQAIASVRWSDLDQLAGDYKGGFVRLFVEHRDAFLLNENGTLMLDERGNRMSITKDAFAEHFGINHLTFHNWLNAANQTDVQTGRRDSFTPGARVGTARTAISRAPTEVVAALAPEEFDGLAAAVLDRIHEDTGNGAPETRRLPEPDGRGRITDEELGQIGWPSAGTANPVEPHDWLTSLEMGITITENGLGLRDHGLTDEERRRIRAAAQRLLALVEEVER